MNSSLRVFKCVTRIAQYSPRLADLGEKKTIESEVRFAGRSLHNFQKTNPIIYRPIFLKTYLSTPGR